MHVLDELSVDRRRLTELNYICHIYVLITHQNTKVLYNKEDKINITTLTDENQFDVYSCVSLVIYMLYIRKYSRLELLEEISLILLFARGVY